MDLPRGNTLETKMSGGTIALYGSDELAFGFVTLLQECGGKLEIVTKVGEQDRGRNLYPVVKVHSADVTIWVRGFPPQPVGERNGGNGRNALLLQYSLKDQQHHPVEFQELLQSIKAALVSNGAELE